MPPTMLPTIINTLKPHPFSTKSNLQKVCQETNIAFTMAETRIQLMGMIANYADVSSSNEAFVRKLVSDITEDIKRNRITTPSTSIEDPSSASQTHSF